MIWRQYWGLRKTGSLSCFIVYLFGPHKPSAISVSPVVGFWWRSAAVDVLWCRLIWMNLYLGDNCPSLDYVVINFNALYSPFITADSGSSRDPLILQPTGHNSHWSPVLQGFPQPLFPGVRWDATIGSIRLCPSTHKLEFPSQPPNLCLGLPLVHWIHKVTLTQPCVNIIASLNGICWVLVYRMDNSSASNLILWIQNLPVLRIKPWIKALDSLKQLHRTCGYFIPDPECLFE
jgi:hypothetical protein